MRLSFPRGLWELLGRLPRWAVAYPARLADGHRAWATRAYARPMPRCWAGLVPSAAGLHRGLVCHGRLGLVRAVGCFPFLLSLLFCLK